MQTALPAAFTATRAGKRAEEILRACVHCGFCNATCPTYQLTGDELDGPRGRIYLIKAALEDERVSPVTVRHLDRCLTCRACETTCPSGVAYGELAEIGRHYAEENGQRGLLDRFVRAALVWMIPHRGRFRFFARLGHAFRRLLPERLASAVPAPQPRLPWPRPAVDAPQRVILLEGCVQSVATPGVNRAFARLLAGMGVEAVRVNDEACCGSLALHLGHEATARRHMTQNAIELLRHSSDVEAIVSTASGCGVTVKDYARHLADSPAVIAASWVAAQTLDAAEYLLRHVDRLPKTARPLRVAFQSPCSLQHGSQVRGAVETLLERAGHTLVPVEDAHLCCGSAGTYSVVQAELANALRARKLAALTAARPDVVVSANVGCTLHLAAASNVPVKHWIEILSPEET